MYGPSRAPAYPYAVPRYSAPEPYPGRKPLESHAVNTRYTSPTTLRSKARTGSDAATSRLDTASSGPSPRDGIYNRTYKGEATMGQSTRLRSQSHSQPSLQSRSRSPHPPADMNPYTHPSRHPSSHRRSSSSNVLGSFSFPGTGGSFPYFPHSHGSRVPASNAPGRSHGSEPPPGWPIPASVPYGSAPVSGPRTHSSRYPVPPPTFAPGFVPPRPPTPASHYPFANHGSSGAAYASGSRHDRNRDQRSSEDYDITPPRTSYSAMLSFVR